jgi:hypothetical protein
MLDFETELNRLLFRERGILPQYEFAELAAAMGIADLIEYFHAYAAQSGREELKKQADVMGQNAAGMLASCGILRFGAAGEQLDPRIHTVKASAESPFPRECVTEVFQSGYLYQNRLLRKAAVVVSRGQGYAASSASGEAANFAYGTGDNADDEHNTTEAANHAYGTDDNTDDEHNATEAANYAYGDNADDRSGIPETESGEYAYGENDSPDNNADDEHNTTEFANHAHGMGNNADDTIENGDKHKDQVPEEYPGEKQDENKGEERL